MEKPTIFVIDDEPEICESLKCLFQSVNYNVETYENGNSFLEYFNPNKEGCIIIDVRMPIMSGLELLETLKTRGNRLPVIMITGYGDIPMAVRAMKTGAVDFVLKPINHEYLLTTIKESLQNIPSSKTLVPDDTQECFKRLSDRERQVLELVVKGKLNKEIAYELSISLSTVEAHRSRIMHKLQVKNLAQLIKLYLQSGMETC